MVKIPVNFFRAEIDWTFDALTTYARIMEDQIERLANADRQRLTRTEFQDEAEEQLEWDEYKLTFKKILPRLLRHSCVIAVLGSIEASLGKICEKICEHKSLPLKPKKHEKEQRKKRKDQSFLDIRLSYIENIAKIRIPPHSFTGSLRDLKKVRDYIVHAEGRIGADKAKLFSIVNGLEGFTVGYEFIEIGKGACGSITRQSHEWIDHLMDACGAPYGKIRT